MSMKVLVTGGAGFIGSHLVDLLVSEGHGVAVLDNLVTGRRENLNPAARFCEEDLVSPELEGVVADVRPEVVFHLGAQSAVKPSVDDPRYDARVNVLGLINLLEACTKAGVRKVVFASSGATYGNPVQLPIDEGHPQRPESPYGISKMVAEHYLHYYALDRGLAYTALRYGNVYGPRQDPFGEAGVVAIFAQQMLSGNIPTIHWDGEQVRDYVYVGDVARANLAAANAGDGECYCVAAGRGTTVNQLYAVMAELCGISDPPKRGPRRPGDLRAAFFDCSKAKAELGWEATVPFETGVRQTVEWYQTQAK